MKKRLFLLPVLFFVMDGVYAQTTEGAASQLDATVKKLAGELNSKLSEEKAPKIAVGQFVYSEDISPLGRS